MTILHETSRAEPCAPSRTNNPTRAVVCECASYPALSRFPPSLSGDSNRLRHGQPWGGPDWEFGDRLSANFGPYPFFPERNAEQLVKMSADGTESHMT